MTEQSREGRGRLSSFDLLPDEAMIDVAWANDQLRERKLPANMIFCEFNDRLVAKGIQPVSRSSFGRHSIRTAHEFRRHDEARKMAAELTAKLGPEGADNVTIMIGEMLKVAIVERLEKGELSSKALQELAVSLRHAVKSRADSLDTRQKLEREEENRKKAAAVNEVGRKAGVSEETLAEINRALGVG